MPLGIAGFSQAALFEASRQASADAPSDNLKLGNMLLSQHRYPEAMEHYEAILSLNMHDEEARRNELAASVALALQARREGNQEAALGCLQHAREYLPDDPTLLTDLGIQAQFVHQLPLAQEVLVNALKLKPGDLTATYALARVETDRQQFPSAEAHMREYLQAKPDDATAHFGLGHLLYMEQRLEEARTEFQTSIELQPAQSESYYQLGQMDLDAHRDAESRLLFEKTLKRDAHHGGALTGMGIVSYRAKEFAIARDQLMAAVQSSPDYQPAHYYLGLTLARLGDKEASDRELTLATQLAAAQQAPARPQTQP